MRADRSDYRDSDARPRRGAVIVELLLALPVLVIVLLAVLEFGVMMANLQQVSLAARDGALVASQTPDLDTAAAVPPEVVDAVARQLGNSGMAYCRIRLEHNVGGPQTALLEPPGGGCDCGPNAPLVPEPPQTYVRLTVCVDMLQVAPNCLKQFGYDLTGQTASFTTLLRHE